MIGAIEKGAIKYDDTWVDLVAVKNDELAQLEEGWGGLLILLAVHRERAQKFLMKKLLRLL